VAVDALGNPVRLIATAGQTADVTQAEALISNLKIEHVIADKGYDSSGLVETIEAQGAQAVIPPRSNRKQPRDYDTHL
jgi:transposase